MLIPKGKMIYDRDYIATTDTPGFASVVGEPIDTTFARVLTIHATWATSDQPSGAGLLVEGSNFPPSEDKWLADLPATKAAGDYSAGTLSNFPAGQCVVTMTDMPRYIRLRLNTAGGYVGEFNIAVHASTY